MEIDSKVFRHRFEYNGQEIFINPVEECIFKNTSYEEKEKTSSVMAMYGILLADSKRQLAYRKRERDAFVASIRNVTEATLSASGRKITVDAVNAEILNNPKTQECDDRIIEAEFKVTFLEQSIWALQTKSKNITELLKPETFKQ